MLTTEWAKSTWRYFKFEKQRARHADLPCWTSSFAVTFGVQSRWSAGLGFTAMRQWNCLSKQSLF